MIDKSINHALMTRTEFLAEVEKFLRETGLADRTLGVRSVGDAGFVSTLRGGREPRERTRERVVSFMASYRAQMDKPTTDDHSQAHTAA